MTLLQGTVQNLNFTEEVLKFGVQFGVFIFFPSKITFLEKMAKKRPKNGQNGQKRLKKCQKDGRKSPKHGQKIAEKSEKWPEMARKIAKKG